MPDLIGRQIGPYEITGLIGKGSAAAVYQAHPVGTAGVVAIKVFRTQLARDPEVVRRFRREAEAIAALSHPNIVRLFDVGQQDDMFFFVMDLLPGGSLAQRIRERPLNGPRVARYLDQIARALDYAHGESIVHRDLRPQNVLFDSQGNAILTDFGISALTTTDLSAPPDGSFIGAPAYMAPEQWQSRDVDGRADLYALGVLVYEMLAGQPPFTGDTTEAIMQAHLSGAPPSIRTIRRDLPESVETVLEKALAQGREARFQSGSAFSEAFRTALRGRVPSWLEVGVPPDAASVASSFPRSRRRSSRRASRREAAASLPARPKGRRLGLLTIGFLAIIGIAAVVLVLLASRNRNGPNAPPTTTLQLAVAPSLTATAPQSPSAVLAATSTPHATLAPSLTASHTASPAPSDTPTPDIPATVAQIVAMTNTADATLASPTPSLTASRTASPASSGTPTPDIPATVAQIVAMTNTADATLASPTPSVTASHTASHTASPTASASPTPTPGPTHTGTQTPDIPATVAYIVGQTNTAIALSASPTPTYTLTFTPSATPTRTFTATASLTPSHTATVTATFTPSITPTGTITPDIPATVAHIVGQTNTAVAQLASPAPTITPTFTPSVTPTPSLTPSATPTGTATPDIPATVSQIVGLTTTAQAATDQSAGGTPRSATATVTPTTTGTSETGAVAITTANSANLRAGPGVSFVRLGIARLGQSFPVTGRTAQGNWFQIILPDGREAWVSAGLVQITPSDAPLPIVTPMPTQTLSPTPAT